MVNKVIMKQNSGSASQLKNVVEQSLALLCEGNDEPKTKTRRRFLPLYVDPANRQKVALVSAAGALKSLWKIKPPRRDPRPPNQIFLQLKLTNGA